MAATKMFLIKWYSSSTNLKVDLLILNMYFCVYYKVFSDLEDFWDDLHVSCLKYNALDDFQDVFQTTSWKSSGLFGSHLDVMEVFNQMVLIFHSFKGFSDLEDFWNDLPVSRLKYNALDDFQEVFQTTSISVVWTSWKSSGLPGSLLTKSSSISSGVQAYLYRGMIYNSFNVGSFILIQHFKKHFNHSSNS
ncbi:hypothetical protein IGI04_014076 [Brassica rapa subsp. trilocularis]|uniref:Uncharacterized protein n=1 Tax=Brassica rapa subsp. trilocularis TaxID=1813537 RepID=A0ABQ7ML48_BRACM|nr:hypothetical protein IGI04_014076 [Brassica rapa subsp. trilocularis]